LQRFFRLTLRGAAQGPPLAGVVAGAVHPAGVLFATALLLALFARRGAHPREIEDAGIRTRDVLLVHGGAFAIFGLFYGGLLAVLVGNGHLDLSGLRGAIPALPWIALFVAAELGIDLARLRSVTAADLTRRVDAGNRRFVLFWFVGFFGVFATILLGKPLVIFALFAGLKLLFELGAAFRLSPAGR
jgi:hypothetical protein